MTPKERAAIAFLAAHGEHLHALLCEVALQSRLPEWVTLSAAGLGIELGGVLRRAVEVESRGDRQAVKG